ncbi:MAG: glycosyltransferase family 39 protein, partial [Chloroflexi bacterium]|nr:glycosyltransferase family 39 protein [Chloroflexota bacterium]
DLFATRAAQAAVGALGVLLAYHLGQAMFDERAGCIAAGLYAAYPIFIFYDAALVATSGATLFMLLALVAAERAAWPRASQPAWAFTSGLMLGLGGAFQPALLTGSPTALGWPLIAPGDLSRRRRAGMSGLIALGIVAGALPFSLWTSRFTGEWALYSHSPQNNFYIGNNHQANGGRADTLALQATEIKVRRGETTYAEAMIDDIRRYPGRLAQLLVRKFALMWSNAELPNLVNYDAEGPGYSLSLRLNPLNFAVVATLAFAGFILTFRENRNAWLLLSWAVALSLGTALAFVTSRQRAPIVPPLIVLAGAAIDRGLKAWGSGDRALRLRWAGALAAAFLTSLTMAGLAEWLPRPPVSSSPPPEANRTFGVIDDSVKVLAAEVLPPAQPGQPIFVTVYWQVTRPLGKDYVAFVQLIDARGGKWAQGDIEAGATSSPAYPTSKWRPGQVIRDEYLLVIPGDMPTPLAGWVYVGLYDKASGDRLPATTEDGQPLEGDAAHIGPLSITQSGHAYPVPEGATLTNYNFGGVIALSGYRLNRETDRARLDVALHWKSLRPTTTDYVVFVHLLDSAGRPVAGNDRRPRDGDYPTNAWQAGETIEDPQWIDLPPGLLPGMYRVEIGLYRADTQERLPVVDARGAPVPDNSLPLGVIELKQ